MPVSVVVGGQFGSEGKGKVALEWVRKAEENRIAVVRVGGPNSGHTGYNREGRKFALRQLPAAAIDRNVDVVFPAGSFIDVEVLTQEIALLDYPRNRIFVSPYANIITAEHREWEQKAQLVSGIGSTGSGVGAAVMALVARESENFPLQRHDAAHCDPLERYLHDTSVVMRQWLDAGSRIIVEGTQGFGLSLMEGGYWPKATSRQTTAAAAVSEAGLSPLDVEDITLVLRTYPIRVAGDSGPLPGETTWEAISRSIGTPCALAEYTTVTKKLRRVGKFEPGVVRAAIAVNNPSTIVLNHMDYVSNPREFADAVEISIGRRVDYFGSSPKGLETRRSAFV